VISKDQWHITNPHFGKLCEGVCKTFKLSKCQRDKWQYGGGGKKKSMITYLHMSCATLIPSSYNNNTAILTVLVICVLYCQTHHKTNGKHFWSITVLPTLLNWTKNMAYSMEVLKDETATVLR
jgi:hypothetical protein